MNSWVIISATSPHRGLQLIPGQLDCSAGDTHATFEANPTWFAAVTAGPGLLGDSVIYSSSCTWTYSLLHFNSFQNRCRQLSHVDNGKRKNGGNVMSANGKKGRGQLHKWGVMMVSPVWSWSCAVGSYSHHGSNSYIPSHLTDSHSFLFHFKVSPPAHTIIHTSMQPPWAQYFSDGRTKLS